MKPESRRLARANMIFVEKTIGVLGGMGPEATVSFFRQLVLLTPAKRDQDHFKIVVVNNPKIPDRTAFLEGRGASPLPLLLEAAKDLERLGADFIAIPCNTAHAFLKEIRQSVAIPVLDIVQVTVNEVARRLDPEKTPSVAVLATPVTVRLRLYQDRLEAKGFRPLIPDEPTQRCISKVIDSFKGPRDVVGCEAWMADAIERLRADGASALLYGCTELGLAPVKTELPIFDSTVILAQASAMRASVPPAALEKPAEPGSKHRARLAGAHGSAHFQK